MGNLAPNDNIMLDEPYRRSRGGGISGLIPGSRKVYKVFLPKCKIDMLKRQFSRFPKNTHKENNFESGKK